VRTGYQSQAEVLDFLADFFQLFQSLLFSFLATHAAQNHVDDLLRHH